MVRWSIKYKYLKIGLTKLLNIKIFYKQTYFRNITTFSSLTISLHPEKYIDFFNQLILREMQQIIIKHVGYMTHLTCGYWNIWEMSKNRISLNFWFKLLFYNTAVCNWDSMACKTKHPNLRGLQIACKIKYPARKIKYPRAKQSIQCAKLNIRNWEVYAVRAKQSIWHANESIRRAKLNIWNWELYK